MFCDNIDPFIAVLDVEATTRTIQGIQGELNTMIPENEALGFSICLAAVVSLEKEEAELKLGLPKPRMLARLRLGTEKALADAKFMTARSLVVTQAFAIYNTILPQLGAAQLAASHDSCPGSSGTLDAITSRSRHHQRGRSVSVPHGGYGNTEATVVARLLSRCEGQTQGRPRLV